MEQTENKKRITSEKATVELNMDELVRGIKKFWILCVVLALIFGGIMFVKEQVSYVPQYTAQVTLTVTTQNASETMGGVSVYSFYYNASTANQLTDTFPLILESNLLQDAVCEDLGITSLPVRLSASSVEGSGMFTISATGKDPVVAYEVLNSVIENYPSVAKYAVGNIEFKIITSPTIPTEPSNSNDYIDNVLYAAIAGFAVGCVVIVLYAYLRKTIKNKSDVKAKLNSDVVGTIPHVAFKRSSREEFNTVLYTNERIDSAFGESLRVLRNVFNNALGEDDKVVIGTSTAPGEGKTTVVTNLALALAENGKKVLLVDGDLRNPSVAPLLNIDIENIKFMKVTKKYKIAYLNEYGIYFMLFQGDNGHQFKYMNSSYAKEIFDEIRDDYDIVLVDTPPCGLVSDALFFAQAADAAFYVILQDTVGASRVKSGLNNLMSTDINILGCVINGIEREHSRYGYGYGYKKYGYGYGYGHEKKKHHRKQG